MIQLEKCQINNKISSSSSIEKTKKETAFREKRKMKTQTHKKRKTKSIDFEKKDEEYRRNRKRFISMNDNIYIHIYSARTA